MDNAIIRALRERAARFTSLDSPQGGDVVDVATDVGAGFVPVVGTALSARDFERARREGDRLGMGLAAAGMLPVVGGVARAADKARKGTRAAEATAKALRKAPQDEALRTAQENAVRMLGLPPGNTPMDRARAMGFSESYHGTNKAIDQIDMSRAGTQTGNPNAHLGFFSTPNAAEASRYTIDFGALAGGNVMPLMIRRGNEYPMSYKEMNDIAMGLFTAPGNTARERYLIASQIAKDKKASLLSEGYDTAVFRKGQPVEEVIALKPEVVRSRFAAFDPARINENDIMGYATPAMLGTLALGSAGAMGAVAALRQRDEDKDKKGK